MSSLALTPKPENSAERSQPGADPCVRLLARRLDGVGLADGVPVGAVDGAPVAALPGDPVAALPGDPVGVLIGDGVGWGWAEAAALRVGRQNG